MGVCDQAVDHAAQLESDGLDALTPNLQRGLVSLCLGHVLDPPLRLLQLHEKMRKLGQPIVICGVVPRVGVRSDLDDRRLDLLVDDREIQRRLAESPAHKPHYTRGYGWMYLQHILGADKGCDFDFLQSESLTREGAEV